MKEAELTELITSHPDRGDLPVALVKAICMKESSFREWAHKPEDHYRWLVGDKLTMGATERSGQKMSWGLMQVMGANARESGFTGTFLSELCDPYVGLKYGMLYLRRLHKKYGDWHDVISSYNAGSVRRRETDKKYENQEVYVDIVLKYWREYNQGAELKESEV